MKINHKKIEYKGIGFDSEGELNRYIFLLDKEKKGVISDLILKPKYNLLPKATIKVEEKLKTKIRVKEKVICGKMDFTPDFAYTRNGVQYHEDYKGCKDIITDTYKIKKKMLYFFHKILVVEVFSATEKLQGDK